MITKTSERVHLSMTEDSITATIENWKDDQGV